MQIAREGAPDLFLFMALLIAEPAAFVKFVARSRFDRYSRMGTATVPGPDAKIIGPADFDRNSTFDYLFLKHYCFIYQFTIRLQLHCLAAGLCTHCLQSW